MKILAVAITVIGISLSCIFGLFFMSAIICGLINGWESGDHHSIFVVLVTSAFFGAFIWATLYLEAAKRGGTKFGIASCMAREVMWENDEGAYNETPAERWKRVRAWAVRSLRSPTSGGSKHE